MTRQKVPATHQARKAARLCVRGCGRRAVKSKTRCWRCERQQNAYQVAYRARRKAEASQ